MKQLIILGILAMSSLAASTAEARDPYGNNYRYGSSHCAPRGYFPGTRQFGGHCAPTRRPPVRVRVYEDRCGNVSIEVVRRPTGRFVRPAPRYYYGY